MKEFVFYGKTGKSKDTRRYTVVGRVDDDLPNTARFAVALCSADDNFVKKVGRELATERVNAGKTLTFVFTETGPTGIEPKEFDKALKVMLYNFDWPHIYFKMYPNLSSDVLN